jgi:hypothetical protein
MPLIYVKTKEGRVAFTAAKGGQRIPSDRAIPVEDTAWVRRLAEVHGDIEIQAAPAAKPDAPAPVADKKAATGDKV